MQPRASVKPLALCFSMVLLPGLAFCCLHQSGTPVATTSSVKQAAQQALILHHDGVEDLIVKVDYKGEQIASLGWIIPVPAAPSHYAVADKQLFKDLRRLLNLRRDRPIVRTKSASGARHIGSKSKHPSLKLLPDVSVGPFAIQPIQAQGPLAVKALNKWMKQNDFPTFEAEQLSYYIDRQWTFLAVRISPEKGKAMQNKGSLPPLQITFPSKRVVYPLKLSTHMGVFSTQVTVLSAKKFAADDFAGARSRGFEVVYAGRHQNSRLSQQLRLRARTSFEANAAPGSMAALINERFANVKDIQISVLLNERVNRGKKRKGRDGVVHTDSPAEWEEDLSVPGVKADQKLMGIVVATAAPKATETSPSKQGDPLLPRSKTISDDEGAPTPAIKGATATVEASDKPEVAKTEVAAASPAKPEPIKQTKEDRSTGCGMTPAGNGAGLGLMALLLVVLIGRRQRSVGPVLTR